MIGHQRHQRSKYLLTNSQYANVQPFQGWYRIYAIDPRLRRLHRGLLIFTPCGGRNHRAIIPSGMIVRLTDGCILSKITKIKSHI